MLLIHRWHKKLYQPSPKGPSSTLTLDSFIPAILTSVRKDSWSMLIEHSLSPGDLFFFLLLGKERCWRETFVTVNFHANLFNLMLQMCCFLKVLFRCLIYHRTGSAKKKKKKYYVINLFLWWNTKGSILNSVLVAIFHLVV